MRTAEKRPRGDAAGAQKEGLDNNRTYKSMYSI